MDRLARRSRRRDHREPPVECESGQGLGESRHVRQLRKAAGRAHRQRAKLPALDDRGDRRNPLDGEVGAAGDRVLHALVGNVQQADARADLERFAEHSGERSRAGARKGELAGVGLCERDELRERVDFQLRARDERERAQADHRDAREIVLRAVGKDLRHVLIDGEHRRRCEQIGVAVGLSARRRLRAKGCVARAVVDEDLLAQLARERAGNDARDDVGHPARRLRNDHPHRPRRPALRARAVRAQNEGGQQPKECAAHGSVA